jgi:hypothetical protein
MGSVVMVNAETLLERAAGEPPRGKMARDLGRVLQTAPSGSAHHVRVALASVDLRSPVKSVAPSGPADPLTRLSQVMAPVEVARLVLAAVPFGTLVPALLASVRAERTETMLPATMIPRSMPMRCPVSSIAQPGVSSRL